MSNESSRSKGLIVTFYCKDPDSQGDQFCETFYETSSGSWIVQAKTRGDDVREQLIALAPDETYGEMSDRTVNTFVKKYAKERYGVDLDRADR